MFNILILLKLFIKEKCNNNSFLKCQGDNLVRKDGFVVILIDMQKLFIKQLKKSEESLIIVNQILMIRWCVKNNIPIVVLEYKGVGETINILAKELKGVRNLTKIIKPHNNGFSNTELDDMLINMGARNLFFMGINASVCVKSTAKGAIEKGYSIMTSENVISEERDGDKSIPWYIKNGTVIAI